LQQVHKKQGGAQQSLFKHKQHTSENLMSKQLQQEISALNAAFLADQMLQA